MARPGARSTAMYQASRQTLCLQGRNLPAQKTGRRAKISVDGLKFSYLPRAAPAKHSGAIRNSLVRKIGEREEERCCGARIERWTDEQVCDERARWLAT